MNEFLKMDIFFVVSTVAVVLVLIAVLAALVFLVKFMRTLDRIANNIEDETIAIRKDIESARAEVRTHGARVGTLLSLFGTTAARFFGRSKKK